jgi:hypothetical protein
MMPVGTGHHRVRASFLDGTQLVRIAESSVTNCGQVPTPNASQDPGTRMQVNVPDVPRSGPRLGGMKIEANANAGPVSRIQIPESRYASEPASHSPEGIR